MEGGKVHIEGDRVKPSRPVRPGTTIEITRTLYRLEVEVLALAERRGSATIAQTLYEETPASVEARTRAVAQRRLQSAGLQTPAARPDRRGRRAIKALKERPEDDLQDTQN